MSEKYTRYQEAGLAIGATLMASIGLTTLKAEAMHLEQLKKPCSDDQVAQIEEVRQIIADNQERFSYYLRTVCRSSLIECPDDIADHLMSEIDTPYYCTDLSKEDTAAEAHMFPIGGDYIVFRPLAFDEVILADFEENAGCALVAIDLHERLHLVYRSHHDRFESQIRDWHWWLDIGANIACEDALDGVEMSEDSLELHLHVLKRYEEKLLKMKDSVD